MEHVRNTEANPASAQSCCAPAAKSGWLNSRNLLIGAAIAGGGGALVWGSDWLVAAGLATFIVAAAPCAVMCALGLCANRMGRKSPGAVAPSVPPKEASQPAAEAAISAEAGASEKARAQAPGAAGS
jgi:hypothetical protein